MPSGETDQVCRLCFDLLSSELAEDLLLRCLPSEDNDLERLLLWCFDFLSFLLSESTDFDLERFLHFDFVSSSFGDDLLLRCLGDLEPGRDDLLTFGELSRLCFGESESTASDFLI